MLRIALLAVSLLLTVGCAVSNVSSRADGGRGIVIFESDVDAYATFSGGAPVPIQGGEYNAVPMAPGYYALAVESEGYLPRRYDLQVNANEEVRIRIEMWPEVEEIDHL